MKSTQATGNQDGHFLTRLDFHKEDISFQQKYFTYEIVVPNMPVWIAQANLGQRQQFKHMH